MQKKEISHIISAIIVMTVVAGFYFALNNSWNIVAETFLFSAIIISVSIFAKKSMASWLDADVEHEIWYLQWFGFAPSQKFKKPIPAGIIFPILISGLSLGIVKPLAFLTYETKALTSRAAKKFGWYSFTEMTEWHNALVGTAGIFSLLILSAITYLIPGNTAIEYLSRLSAYYAFWNILPISKLDGTQIFFGSRVLWTITAIITTIFAALALLIA